MNLPLFRPALGACLAAVFFFPPAIASEPWLLNQAEIVPLAAAAPAALRVPITTVVEKPQPSPGGDPQDYVSYSRYFWPDPTKSDGLPWISRDGEHNLEQVARGDWRRLWTFVGTVETLAAKWHASRDKAAALRAGEWLRAWFVAPETRMNPNLEYAQIQPGRKNNRGYHYGVLDARGLGQVIDALRMLDDSPALTSDEAAVVRAWFQAYLDWLVTSENGRGAYAAKNNHGTWYLAQAGAIARYCGRDDLARQFCEDAKGRIANQIEPDGSQSLEIRRANGINYSVFNLEAYARIARLAAGLGIDLWNYTAPNGAGLLKAVDYLRPYNTDPQSWPHNQKTARQPGFLDALITEANAARRS